MNLNLRTYCNSGLRVRIINDTHANFSVSRRQNSRDFFVKVTYYRILCSKSESMIQSLISNSKYILICSIFEHITPSIDFWAFRRAQNQFYKII